MSKWKLYTNKIKRWFTSLRAGSYLRELSVVIIGVAVTFYVSGWITDMREKKDLNLQLEAVYNELENNLEEVKHLDAKFKTHQKLGELLRQVLDDPEAIAPDSIGKYSNEIVTISMFNYHTATYNMFINSGAIKLMTNRKLLLEISECYSQMDLAKEESVMYNNFKMNEFQGLMHLDKKRVLKQLDIMNPEYNALFNFYTSMTVGHTTGEVIRHIENVLTQRKTKH